MKPYLIISVLLALFTISCNNISDSITSGPIENPWTKSDYWSYDNWSNLGSTPYILQSAAMDRIWPHTEQYDLEKGIVRSTLPGKRIKILYTYYSDSGTISTIDSVTITFDNFGKVITRNDYKYSYINNFIDTVFTDNIISYTYSNGKIDKILYQFPQGHKVYDVHYYEEDCISSITYNSSSQEPDTFKPYDSTVIKINPSLNLATEIKHWDYDESISDWSDTQSSSTQYFEFNSIGKLINKRYGESTGTRYTYNLDNKLDSVIINDSIIYTANYNNNGSISSYMREGYNRTDYTYDSLTNYPKESIKYNYDSLSSSWIVKNKKLIIVE